MQYRFFYFGTIYHPERYPHDGERLAEDVRLMRNLHMNAALLSSETIRYAMGVGGGYVWLQGILNALGEAGIHAGIEIPDPLPGSEILQKLDACEYVRFFKAGSSKREKALKISRLLRQAGLAKPVSVFVQERDLFRPSEDYPDADFIEIACHPEWSRGERMTRGREASFLEDRARSLKGQPFFLTDVDPVRTVSEGVSKLRKPHNLTLEIFQAAIHGARGCFFRDLRQRVSGEDRLSGAVIGLNGRVDTHVQEEIAQIGLMLGEITEMAPTETEARCAVICGSEEAKGDTFRIYEALRKLGVSVDVLGPGDSYERYAFIAACGMSRVSEENAGRIRAYVERGGTWLAEWGFATEDASGICYEGDVPHHLTDVFGILTLETEGLFPDEAMPLQTAADFKGKFVSRRLCELLEVLDADVVVRYDSEDYRGRPALARKHFGEGFAYYMATDCDDALLAILCDKILKGQKGIARVKMAEGIAVQRLTGEEAEYLVFQNFNDREKRLPLDYNKLDILFGYDPVPAFGCLVLRVPKTKGRAGTAREQTSADGTGEDRKRHGRKARQ